MGATEFGRIVICGWNSTALELIENCVPTSTRSRSSCCTTPRKNPRGGVYFVHGGAASAEDLERAGIKHASSAIICPTDTSGGADMRTLLIVLAIEDIAPGVRTVMVEVNNPRHLPHFNRTRRRDPGASRLASRLQARTALYPGLKRAGYRYRVRR